MIFLIILATVLAVVALVAAIGLLMGRHEARLERRLAGYEPIGDVEPAKEVGSGGTTTPGVSQAVDLTSRLAGRTSLLTRVESALERGDVPIRAGELIFYTVAGTIMVFMLVTLLTGPITGLILAAVVGMIPALYVSRQQRTRKTAFEHQLPDTLTLLASSLRAGFSFMQGLEAVAQEIGAPMRRELQRVFTEVRLGRTPEDALADAADRMDSKDLAWTVMAIKIQREVGGNLASLLDTVADTMLKRDRIRREISALTAEGRLSAIVLGLLPFAAGTMLFLAAPDYMKTLFDTGVGIAAVIGAVGLAVFGWIWLRKIVDIEV